jgi:hypothetical protein
MPKIADDPRKFKQISRQNAEIVHNCPQMPANPWPNPPITGVFSPFLPLEKSDFRSERRIAVR